LKEDAYGTLQQDIPKILEALTRMLLALENYSQELRATAAAVDGVGDAPHGLEVYETEIAIDEFITPYTNGEYPVLCVRLETDYFGLCRAYYGLEGRHDDVWGSA
jgi:Nucleoporin protein Ndc1-Nup